MPYSAHYASLRPMRTQRARHFVSVHINGRVVAFKVYSIPFGPFSLSLSLPLSLSFTFAMDATVDVDDDVARQMLQP